MIDDLRRIRHGDWFIQSCASFRRKDFFAWSSKEPSTSAILAEGLVCFDFGDTEAEAIEKVIAELAELEEAKP